jgi:peptidoglycan/LPS O-acetylase OafA/YrhL
MQMAGARFRVLDSCRGLCAVLVMLFHTDAITHWYWTPLVRNGYVAVDFFFVLSGFVIASAYHDRLGSLGDMGRFVVRRFGRLYPLHLAVLLAYVVLELVRLFIVHAPDAFTGNTSVYALVENLFLVQGFTTSQETWNYPSWSISVEFWVNIAFAMLAATFQRRFVAIVACILTVFGAALLFWNSLALRVAPAEAAVLLDAVQSVFEFFLGFAAFWLFRRAQRSGWKPVAAVELLLPIPVVLAFGYADSLPTLGLPLAFCAVVFVLAFEEGLFSTLLRHRSLTGLGAISYSIYLTHSLYLLGMGALISIAARLMGRPSTVEMNGDELSNLGGPWAMDAAALACVAVAIVGSILTYRYIEEPARLFFNRLSSSPVVQTRVRAPA